MKKINLKNILKKTFKKKKVKKNKIIKKVYKKKIKKKIIKTKKIKKKIEKISKVNKTVSAQENKQSNLKVIKSTDQKPEIKKIKNQGTEKKEFKVKDYVNYPKDGVGQITEIKKITIGGIGVEVYIIKLEKEKAELKFPINKQSLLRPLASVNQLNKCISILKGKPKIKRSMWSRRAQEYEAKIGSGKIYDLAEVVRDLNKGDDLLVDQSYSERQLFEKAYERLLSEFQIILGITTEETQKKLDKALKRNIESQTPKTIPQPETESTQELEETPE